MRSLLCIFFVLLAAAFASCSRSSEAKARLDAAEALIVSRPDSAMAILCGIDTACLVSKADRAQFALLMSMALDKNYVDTTSFAVLQPAIDYYLKKGTPDQKLRTYYYQGRIYQNRHEYDSAMVAFIRGKEYSPQAADTLTAANLLVAQSILLKKSYIFEEYIDLNLIAAKMYRNIGRTDYEIECLTDALKGCITLDNQQRADSILIAIEQIVDQDDNFASIVTPAILRYISFYGDRDEVISEIGGYEPEDFEDDDMLIDIANAYHRIGHEKNAVRFLEATSPEYKQGLRYKSTKAVMYDMYDDKDEAFKAYREATSLIDSINIEVFHNDLLFLQERHAIERDKQIELRKMDRIVWFSICTALALLVVSSFIYYRYHLNRAKSEKLQLESEQQQLKSEHLQLKNEQLRLKSEKLQLESEQLQLKNEQLQLESEKLQLESENMKHRIAELENESETLRQVVDEQSDLAKPVKDAVKERLKMLNDLLASMIIEKGPKRLCAYENWCSKMLSDKVEFVNATRQAFEVTNPGFISYLEQHELTDDEINIACLLAIGLKGMEIGNYLQTKNLYRVSSDIRRKLNLDPHQANLGKIIHDILRDT